ncbi:MAG TPA: DNA repair protein RecO, partial [Aggregatilineales bacterium]|nr:DNA repair protein RecO [Aggregatilineales bacterium]
MPRPERTYRTPALILQRRDFGEADRLLTLLTPDHGRVEAIAKGARKPVSTKTGHVELFTRADMLINKGRELDIIAQVVMAAPYLPLREDLQRGAFANYVAELVLRFTTQDNEEDPRLFTLVDTTFERLCLSDDPRLVVRYYELHLLDRVGFRPELTRCVISRVPVQPEDQYFSYAEGGVVSRGEAEGHQGLVAISVNALKLLRHLQRSPYDAV